MLRMSILGGTALAMLLAGGAWAQVIYVSPDGSDDDAGTLEAPVATIAKALELAPQEIFLEVGEYTVTETVVLPAGLAMSGGWVYLNEGGNWAARKQTLATRITGQGLTREAVFELRENSRLLDVTVVGGFVGARLREGSSLWEVIFRRPDPETENHLSFALVDAGVAGNPSRITRCQFWSGSTGILVEGAGSAEIEHALIRNPIQRGVSIRGSGTVHVRDSHISGADSDGIAIVANPNVTIERSVIRANTGDGINMTQTTGGNINHCLLERNERGVAMSEVNGPWLRHNTIVDNRGDGVLMRLSIANLVYNAIADNNGYGVRESPVDEDSGAVPDPLLELGGDLWYNQFSANAEGNYLDRQFDIYNTAAEINTNTVNSGVVEGNRVGDPLFLDPVASNYRPSAGSPLIDEAASGDSLSPTDADGNPRDVAIPGVGQENHRSKDIGAFEYQPHLLTNFGSLYYDAFVVPDPYGGDPIPTQQAPEWSVSPLTAPVFNQIVGQLLPGRMRLYSQDTNTFGAAVRTRDDVDVADQKLVVGSITVDPFDASGMRTPRLRIEGGKGALDVVHGFNIEGLVESFPGAQPRTYEFIYDFYQGNYRLAPPAQDGIFDSNFLIDFLDFVAIPHQAKMDITHLELQAVDRAQFDAQFTNQRYNWTFATDAEGWGNGGLPGTFPVPTMEYDAGAQALRMDQTQVDEFGAWYSPLLTFEPGARFKATMTARSATDDRKDQPSFRLRLQPLTFEFATGLLTITGFQGPVGPGTESVEFVMYGAIPEHLAADKQYQILVDLWGFGWARNAQLFIEEVTIETDE